MGAGRDGGGSEMLEHTVEPPSWTQPRETPTELTLTALFVTEGTVKVSLNEIIGCTLLYIPFIVWG